ncbi:MAG: DUF5320 domain-containing protein [Promethearchaeota archaeon]
MWRGRGFRWFGRGFGFGLGLGFGRQFFFPGYGMGRGLGPNPYLNCRWFPWLPRWWWANPAYSQYLPQLQIPYSPTMPITPTLDPTQEKQMLEAQINQLTQTIENIKQRLKELEEK